MLKYIFNGLRSILEMRNQIIFFLPRARREIWNDQGVGSSEGSYFQGRYSRIFSQAIDGVFTLHNFCAQVCDQHGKVQRMQSCPRFKERTYLQLLGGKNFNSTRGLEQILPK